MLHFLNIKISSHKTALFISKMFSFFCHALAIFFIVHDAVSI